MTETTAPSSPDIIPNPTPSGILVEYCADPRQYWVDSQPVPSVTTINDVLKKDALTWWGMKVGVEGLQELARRQLISVPSTWDTDALVGLLTKEKLTVNHVRDKAGDRGTNVHSALEDWCRTGIKPDPRNFPPQEEGWVRAIAKFTEEVVLEPIHTELMVGSARYQYAGRFDLMARTPEQEIKTGPRTKRKVPAGIGVIDLKTRTLNAKGERKPAYKENYLQLAAYAEACIECGYGRSEYEMVLLAYNDGTYDLSLSPARFSQFLDVKRCYDALKGLK